MQHWADRGGADSGTTATRSLDARERHSLVRVPRPRMSQHPAQSERHRRTKTEAIRRLRQYRAVRTRFLPQFTDSDPSPPRSAFLGLSSDILK